MPFSIIGSEVSAIAPSVFIAPVMSWSVGLSPRAGLVSPFTVRSATVVHWVMSMPLLARSGENPNDVAAIASTPAIDILVFDVFPVTRDQSTVASPTRIMTCTARRGTAMAAPTAATGAGAASGSATPAAASLTAAAGAAAGAGISGTGDV